MPDLKDAISFTLADSVGLMAGGWGIDEGTGVSGRMGYDGTGTTVPCGLYTVGEVESRGGVVMAM